MWSQEAEKDISIFIFLIRWFIRIIELIFTVILEFISILLFVVVDQSLNCVWLFVTPWTEACQAPLSFTISWSLLKCMSIEPVMPSNRLIFCHPLLLLPSILATIRVFSSESVLQIRWPKYCSFSLCISPFNGYSGLISFRIDWFDLLAVQHHSLKASIFQCVACFTVQVSQPYMTTGKKTITLTIWIFVGKVMSLLFNTLSRFISW